VHSKFGTLTHYMTLFLFWWKIFRYRSVAWVKWHPFWNFRTPLYFQNSQNYLVHVLNITCTSHRMTNYPIKWAWSGSRELNLKFMTLYNIWTDKATRSNFLCEYLAWSSLSAEEKLPYTGVAWVTWPVFKFRNPTILSEWLKVEAIIYWTWQVFDDARQSAP